MRQRQNQSFYETEMSIVYFQPVMSLALFQRWGIHGDNTIVNRDTKRCLDIQ